MRLSVQRVRLFRAASALVARVGYADASAEAIAREAGMSKATFYEHFGNKEECVLALFDEGATEVMRAMGGAAEERRRPETYEEWVRRRLRAFLQVLTDHPNAATTLLVMSAGAGPRLVARRDAVVDTFAEVIFRDNRRMGPRLGGPTFASRDDARAVVGAIVELVIRHLREGRAEELASLEPVLTRVVLGVASQGA